MNWALEPNQNVQQYPLKDWEIRFASEALQQAIEGWVANEEEISKWFAKARLQGDL